MIKSRLNFFTIIIIVSFHFISCSQSSQITKNSKLYEWLISQKDLTVKEINTDSEFSEMYEIFIEQPVDHSNPDGPKFKQQFFLAHRNENLPVVIELDGYAVNYRQNELSRLLNCNQIIVEHRYFGESIPEPFDWKYLDIRQSAADHHRIIKKLKEFYKNKWVSTGISKGGSTVIFHKRFYPNDVDASVAYVAPINFSVDDNRVYEWFKTVSSADCRQRIKNLQKYILRNRDIYYPKFVETAEKKKYEYKIAGLERAFEYCVLEYSFAYWQWNSGGCESIPDTTESNEVIFNHFKDHAGLDYFSDESIKSLYPFWYQCYTEYGYYAYDISDFKDLLKYADGKTYFFIPDSLKLEFNPEPMKDISNWVTNYANNMIFIYGGNDPWTSTGVCLSGKTNSLKMVLPGGSHQTKIRNFRKEDRKLIYSKIEDWLRIKIDNN